MRTGATEADRAAAATLLRMIWGIHVSRCVYAVAELGIADLLLDGSLGLERVGASHGLSRAVALPGASRARGTGRVEEHDQRRFCLTAVGERLRRDAPVSMRSWAIFREALGGVRSFQHVLGDG